MKTNYGHTQTVFANARHDSEWRKRKRHASVLVCGLENNHGRTRMAFAWLAACAARPPYPDGRTAMERRPYQEWHKRKRRWVVSLAQYPFAEKGAAEAVFPVVVVDYVLSFKFGDGLFDGCGVEDLCRFEEGAGEYLPAAADGYGAENARLLRGKLLERKCEVVVFPCEYDGKGLLDVGFLKCCPFAAHLPECIAEFLDEARGVACGAGDGVKHCAREFPSAGGEAFLYEREKFVRVYVPDLERGGGMVERAGILEEDLRHLVTYAAEEDVRSVGVELDSGAQHGERPFTVVYVENVLELVEKDARLAPLGLRQKNVKHGIERCRLCRNPRVHCHGRSTGRRVDGNRRSEVREHAHGLCYPAFGIFKSCERGDKPAADVRLVADTEKIGMEEGNVLHVPNGFENEGRLPSSAVSLHYDVLSGLYARSEFLLERGTRAKEVSVNSASVFERVHCHLSFFGSCAKWCYAKRCYTIWHNGGIISCLGVLWQWGFDSARGVTSVRGSNKTI